MTRRKRRYYMVKDFYAGLSTDTDWAVYDRTLKGVDEPPLAIFQRRSDAQDYARRLNRTRGSR